MSHFFVLRSRAYPPQHAQGYFDRGLTHQPKPPHNAMSHVSVRLRRAYPPQHAQGYFDPENLTEQEAGDLWRECMKQIDENLQTGKAAAGRFKVRDQVAQLAYLIQRNGHLERFWLRLLHDNTLLIVGCRRGLLPLNVEPLHV